MAESDVRVASVSVADWTTVPPNVSVTIRFSSPVDARSAQAGIRLLGADAPAEVRLSRDGTEATWTPLSPLPEGDATLLIEDVASRGADETGGGRSVGAAVLPRTVPFRVAASEDPSRPYGHVVLHRSTVRLRASDRRYVATKLLDPRTGASREVAIDVRGRPAELAGILERDARAYARRYGKVHPVLDAALDGADEGETVPVAVWLAVDEEPIDKGVLDLDSESGPPAELLEYRDRIATVQGRVARLIRRRFRAEVSALRSAPVLFAALPPAQVRELARSRDVAILFLHERDGIEDLGDSMEISGAREVVRTQGWTGAGVRVAVWEDAADDLSQLSIQAHFDPARPTTTGHARLVTAIIKNRQPAILVDVFGRPVVARGYAPECRLYAANSTDTEALEWAVTDRHCRVINQSFHRQSEAASGDRSFDDVLKDYLALHYPFPTIVQAAGNYWSTDPDMISPPSDEFVNHKGYNSVSVGNHNDAATGMSGDSVFRNPTTAHDDRELPEMCANGTNVSAVGLSNSGTSFASPAVAGSVALLQQMDETLAWWPEGNRAILLAGARNVVGRSWADGVRAGVDARDGSGALDVEASGQIARSRRRRGNDGDERGWDVGTFEAGEFDGTGRWAHVYRIRVPPGSIFGRRRRVKVALAWNADVVRINAGILTAWATVVPADYDLYVYDDDQLVGWSASWDNSYEIVEFMGEAGKTYTVRIGKASGSAGSYYGIAWIVRRPFDVLLGDVTG
jgi:hypothetical protein